MHALYIIYHGYLSRVGFSLLQTVCEHSNGRNSHRGIPHINYHMVCRVEFSSNVAEDEALIHRVTCDKQMTAA